MKYEVNIFVGVFGNLEFLTGRGKRVSVYIYIYKEREKERERERERERGVSKNTFKKGH